MSTNCGKAFNFLTQHHVEAVEEERENKVPIKYFEAPEIKKQVDQLAEECEFFHVVPQYVFCFRSRGSKARRTIARIHGIGKIWQEVLNLPPSYTIEVISEIYDKNVAEEKEKTLIHELMHIPGGFSAAVFDPTKGMLNEETWKPFTRNCRIIGLLKSRKPCFSGKIPENFTVLALSF